MKLSRVIFAIGPLLAMVAFAPAQAQSWPSRPVTIVAPYPAGGTPDLIARAIAEKMGALLGSPVVVDPKPGGNGAIGTGVVARAAPDGYTLLLATLSHVTNPLLQRAVKWDPVADFACVAEIVTAPVVAVVPSTLPVTNLAEFVAYAKKSPGKLNYLMPGIGTSMHLNTEMLKKVAGIDLVAIPYKGTPLGLPGLLTGELSFAMLPLSTAAAQISSGKLKALAVVSPSRLKQLPDVPTLSQAGFPGAEVLSWYLVLAPAGTPKAIIARLNDVVMKTIADPEIRERLQKLGAYASDPKTSSQIDSMLAAETSRWTTTFRELKIEAQ